MGQLTENKHSLGECVRREAILNTAFTTFKNYDYCKTFMTDITTALGISRVSLYSCFEHKATFWLLVNTYH
jgi:AcrR family transcriptional regulator